MSYRLIYTERAFRDIRRLDPQVKKRVKSALERYSQAPFQFATRLTNPRVMVHDGIAPSGRGL